MNRLATSRSVCDSNASVLTRRYSSHPKDHFGKVESGSGCHATFAPLHYEANYAYPLVVWLHSPGGNERELRRIMPLVSMRNYVGVSARGTVSLDTARSLDTASLDSAETAIKGYDWSQSDDHVFLAQQRVLSSIAAAKSRFNIDSSRVFLAGYQSGGTMAFRVATAQPEHFAGVLSIGGEFPRGGAPLMRYNHARKLPVFLATCRDSKKYAENHVCQDLRLFHAAGIQVTLRQYPCGDEMTTNMLSDMDHWIMDSLSRSVVGVVR